MENNDEVRVTLLADIGIKSQARVTNHRARSLDLLTANPAPLGAAIKLEAGDTLFLGEVRSCHRSESGFTINVELQHALYHLEDLALLARRILDAERL